ncbi:MAG TPA: MFS transporter [Nitrososphaerales archaeon]|nr:MFS transporter [Nitrososphaerales archaeon]
MSQPSQAPSSVLSHFRLIFIVVVAAYFMDVIDASIVTTALPAIRVQFGASIADSQWIYGAYAITTAGFLLLMGRAGDAYGQKKVFIPGLVLFIISSFTAGFAQSLLSMVISRAVQGIGAAMTTVTAFAIFIELFPEGPQRNRAFGYITAILSGGFAVGAFTGGVLTTFVGWRWVMFVNVPIGIVVTLLAQRFLPGDSGRLQSRHLDVPGALTVTSGTILFVYGLTNAAGLGFGSVLTVAPLLTAAALLGAFLFIESRSKAPLMPLSFVRRGSVLTANALALVITSVMGGIGFILPVYFQNILGYSAFYSGLLTLPPALVFLFVGGWGAAPVLNRIGARRTIMISTALVALGALLLTPLSPNGSYFVLLPGLLVWALGASVGMPAMNVAAVAGTQPGEEGLASGIVNTSFRVGFPVGLAVLLTVAGAFDPPPASPATSSAVVAGVVAGFQVAMVGAALLAVLAFAISLRLKDAKPPWGQSPVQAPAP